MLHDKLKAIPRRDLMRLFKEYGKMSVLLAAGGMTGAVTLPGLAQAANSTYEKRLGKKARFNLKFGAAGFNEDNLKIQESGQLWFAQQLESSNGAPARDYLARRGISEATRKAFGFGLGEAGVGGDDGNGGVGDTAVHVTELDLQLAGLSGQRGGHAKTAEFVADLEGCCPEMAGVANRRRAHWIGGNEGTNSDTVSHEGRCGSEAALEGRR